MMELQVKMLMKDVHLIVILQIISLMGIRPLIHEMILVIQIQLVVPQMDKLTLILQEDLEPYVPDEL